MNISTYRIQVLFCLYGTLLPITRIFHPFGIRRCLILICESIKIYAFRNPESTCWTACWCFIFSSIQTPQCSVASLYHNRCFQNNVCAETTPGEFAISLVLVISCEPVIVETESRNFSDLEAQHACSNILAYVHIYIGTSPFWLMDDQTEHEESNNVPCFKHK